MDVRGNQGGHVSELLLEKLTKRRIAVHRPRHGEAEPYPQHAPPSDALVVVTDENASSDGDVFCYSVQRMRLGPVVGQRTWGGVLAVTDHTELLDGTEIPHPTEQFVPVDDGGRAGAGIENVGVHPDIEVEMAPHHYLRGQDPQLRRAVDEAVARVRGGE